jgi:hypothetical protein
MAQEGWLTPARRSSRATGTSWRPPSLPARTAVEKLAYIVVEERVDKVIGVLVAPWPRATQDAHLRFPRTPPQLEVAADLDDLQSFLNRHRRTPAVGNRAQSRELRTRAVALGDVFAARVDREVLAGHDEDEGLLAVAEWLDERVYDVTADAREAARTTFFDAVSPQLPKKVERQMVRQIRHDQ